ncbi:MAG: lysozyme [Flavobacteriaceae bacterium]
MRIDFDTAMEVASHEAVVRQAYRDSGGKWTWSVGLTSATGHDVERYIGKPQSLAHCLRVYVWALDNYAEGVRRAFAGCPLTREQFAAAVSFHWNTGKIATASWVRHFRAGDMARAERAFKLYNKDGGRVSRGLVARRAKEADLLFRGKWSHGSTMTEYTRLTAKATPVWSSARRVEVAGILREALAGRIPDSDKVIVEEEKPVVPETVEEKVREKSSFWKRIANWIGGGGGIGGIGLWLADADWRVIVAVSGAALVIAIVIGGVVVIYKRQIVGAVREIREGLA